MRCVCVVFCCLCLAVASKLALLFCLQGEDEVSVPVLVAYGPTLDLVLTCFDVDTAQR
jgi:hypothetical protein